VDPLGTPLRLFIEQLVMRLFVAESCGALTCLLFDVSWEII
jgi:hypothetical protein